ncbi:MAG: hypothetical protein ACFB51_07530 [Anaerolineae bacterium]
MSRNNIVLSIFEEDITFDLPPGWKHIPVRGDKALQLLRASQALQASLDGVRKISPEHADFSALSKSVVPHSIIGHRIVVVTPALVPLDIVQQDNDTYWGDHTIFSHVLTEPPVDTNLLHRCTVVPEARPLQTYLLACPMEIDRPIPRHLQDIVMTALRYEIDMPVELWLQPSLERIYDAFTRTDVSWLHIDTHGDNLGLHIMLGPTRELRDMVAAGDLPKTIHPPLIMPVGCALTRRSDGIGMTLLHNGAQSVMGPSIVFESLSMSNSDDSEMLWYQTFFDALLGQHDVGESLLIARQKTGESILKYMWVILGSSFTRFS